MRARAIAPAEEVIEVDGAVRRRVLEERVRVVPRPKLRDGAAEALREPVVESALPARERLRGRAISVLERCRELALVQLVRRE